MTYAINIRSDNASSESIRSLWRECNLLEEKPGMESLGYPPHITLAVYDQINEAELFAAFDASFAVISKIKVRFERLGYFEAPDRIILWADPILPGAVTEIHDHIHRLINTDLCRPNYRPGTWVPHCSLATTIDRSRREEAIALTKHSISPIDVIFDVADCASFLPVEVLRERLLSVNG